MCSLIGPNAADAASSRVGGEPAGKPAIPVRRVGGPPGKAASADAVHCLGGSRRSIGAHGDQCSGAGLGALVRLPVMRLTVMRLTVMVRALVTQLAEDVVLFSLRLMAGKTG